MIRLAVLLLVLGVAGGCNRKPARQELDGATRDALKAEIKKELKAELTRELLRELMRAPVARPEVAAGPAPAPANRPVVRNPYPQPDRSPQPVAPRPEPARPVAPPPKAPEPVAEPDPEPRPEPKPEPKPEPSKPSPAPPADDDGGVGGVSEGVVAAGRVDVTQFVVAKDLDRSKREPDGVATTFEGGLPHLYAYVVAKNAGEDTKVTIEWVQGANVRSRIALKVGHSTRGWRTWSKLRLPKRSSGKWTVMVRDENNQIVARSTFTVR